MDDPRLDEVKEYLAKHEERYTRAALRRSLIERGRDLESIEEARRILDEDPVHRARRDQLGRRRRLFLAYVVVLFLGAFLFFALASPFAQPRYQVVLWTLAAVLAFGALLARETVRTHQLLERTTAGIAIALLVPFVIVMLISGTCATLVRTP
jgi:hypothetical protein